MERARAAILAAGGAERANVFTRAQLALFGQVPWRAVPMMPVEIMLLPLWFPFHLSKVSYWSRTVIVPLLVLMALQPRARNPRGTGVAELFRTPPEQVRDYIRGPYRSGWGRFFKGLDSALRAAAPAFPRRTRKRAIDTAVAFVTARLNGEDGLGGIYPAIANSVMMFDTLGFDPNAPPAATAWAAVRKLLVEEPDRAWCQPCLSPVWDTALAGHAVAEAAGAAAPDVAAACAWLRGRQITDDAGDWAVRRPGLRPGGWAFQYWNDAYPDVDDTAVVGMLLHRQGDPAHAEAIARAREWIIGMQSQGRGRFDGGWGAFEPENTHLHLNHIPFADHGALLDPPTADVTARCVSFLAQIGMAADDPVLVRALAFLRREQEADGSWFGRWGTNYIYGTWSVLCALNAAGLGRRRSHGAPRRGLAGLGAARRRRLGRGRGKLRRRPARPLPRKHAEPDRLGRARPDGGRRDGPPGGGARHRLPHRRPARGRGMGRGSRIPPWVSRACSTCATTATGCISRCWRWHDTAACSAATTSAWRSDFKAKAPAEKIVVSWPTYLPLPVIAAPGLNRESVTTLTNRQHAHGALTAASHRKWTSTKASSWITSVLIARFS